MGIIVLCSEHIHVIKLSCVMSEAVLWYGTVCYGIGPECGKQSLLL